MLPLVATGGCASLHDFFGSAPNKRPRVMAVDAGDGVREPVEPIAANRFVLDSPGQALVGKPQVVLASDDDTLSDIARSYGLGYDELVAANPGLDPWLPGDGTPVLLPTQFVIPDVVREGIVLNIASKRLFYFPPVAEGEPAVVETFPIGIGRVGWETPLGSTSVVAKARDPHWYVPWSVRQEHIELGDPLPAVVPPGPDNPLGHRVLQLDMPGYLIHGTNQPYGVGMRVSHGCVRLYPENIEHLFERVDIGEPVTIVNEPYLLAEHDGEWYFEAHAPLEDDAVSADERFDALIEVRNAATERGFSNRDIDSAKRIAAARRGAPTRLRYAPDEPMMRALHVRNIVELDPDAPTLAEVREMIDEAVREGREELAETSNQ